MKLNVHTQIEKLKCDWTDKKNFSFQNKVLEIYVRHRMIADKVQETASFKERRWLEDYISFNTQKRNRGINDFEKEYYKLLSTALYGKTVEHVLNRTKK